MKRGPEGQVGAEGRGVPVTMKHEAKEVGWQVTQRKDGLRDGWRWVEARRLYQHEASDRIMISCSVLPVGLDNDFAWFTSAGNYQRSFKCPFFFPEPPHHVRQRQRHYHP